MHASGAAAFDVGEFLERVEAMAPVQAVEAVAEALAEWVGARRVSFLIADFSGRAVVRLTSTGPGAGAAGAAGAEHPETLPLAGSLYGQVLRTQRIHVRPPAEGPPAALPVPERRVASRRTKLDPPPPRGQDNPAHPAAAP